MPKRLTKQQMIDYLAVEYYDYLMEDPKEAILRLAEEYEQKLKAKSVKQVRKEYDEEVKRN